MTGNGKILLILFGAIISLSTAQNWWESGISVGITVENFEQYVGKNKHVVVDVFAQFCFYCKLMQPEWDKLAQHYMGDSPARGDVIIAKMDAGVEADLANRYGVNAFPSFLLFKKGDIFPSSRYGGERTAQSFIQWIEDAVGPEEIVLVEEPKEDPALLQLLIDLQSDENQKQDEVVQQDSGSHVENGNLDQHMGVIVQKLDFLADLVNNNGDHGSGSGDYNEIKSLITGLDRKIDRKANHNNPTTEEEINFSHGIIFLFLGVFLGIGISFGITNYQKLTRSRKLLVD